MPMQPFRLLRAELWDQSKPPEDLEADIDIEIGHEKGPSEGSWTTVVIGRNGSGKSRFLSAIAAAFDALEGRRLRKRKPVKITYRWGDDECAFHVDGASIHASVNGEYTPVVDLPRPRVVIAATASAFDKFHLPRRADTFEEEGAKSSYRYLGLRDERGRVSARAGIFRALEQLFDASDENQSRRNRVSDVFRYLGYNPAVEVAYLWSRRGLDLLEEADIDPSEAVRRYLKKAAERDVEASRPTIPMYVLEDNRAVEELAEAVEFFRAHTVERILTLTADFRSSNSKGEYQLRMARQLTRIGLMQMTEVTLLREESGDRVEVTDASSGELSLVVTLLGIASAIEDCSLVLIDEPEISLHPQWQSDYLGQLQAAFSGFRDCHFVIATHSPTLVAGADPGATNTVDLEAQSEPTEKALSDRSVDEVLFDTFRVVTKSSLYLRDLLVAALRGASEGSLDQPEHDADMAALQSARPRFPDEDPTGKLIDSLFRIRAQLAEKSAS